MPSRLHALLPLLATALALAGCGSGSDGPLPVAFIERVFDAAERAGADALEKSLQPPQWRRQWAMWRMLATRRL